MERNHGLRMMSDSNSPKDLQIILLKDQCLVCVVLVVFELVVQKIVTRLGKVLKNVVAELVVFQVDGVVGIVDMPVA